MRHKVGLCMHGLIYTMTKTGEMYYEIYSKFKVVHIVLCIKCAMVIGEDREVRVVRCSLRPQAVSEWEIGHCGVWAWRDGW